MKYLFFIIFLCLFNTVLNAQFGEEHIISTEALLPVSIVVADIDGDSFLDVVTGARNTNEVSWFKNEDGQGNFGPLQLILATDDVRSVQVGDLDGDGDLDVIAAAIFLDTFFWQENLDGQGTFGPQRIIDNNADNAYEARAADIDGDGDLDIVGAISNDSRAVWYENLDGQGNFGPVRGISNVLLACRSIFPVDVDGDGDMDVVANSGDQVTISWFENLDGQGNFGAQQIVEGAFSYAIDVFCGDIDGDGDQDIVGVTTSNPDGVISWYENLDGQGNFSVRKNITSGAIACTSVFIADLDNDGDNDILYGSSPDILQETSEVNWSENLDGLGTFGTRQVIGNELQFTHEVYAADIDNDGDLDVFATSQNNHKVVWYENLTILDVPEFTLQNIKIYPNPVQTTLFIENNSGVPLSKVSIIDSKGQTVLQKQGDFKELTIAQLASGIYFVQLENNQGAKTVQKLVKE